MSTRVVVVDDHRMIRESFRTMFASMDGYTVVADVASADDADRVCEQALPHLILLDVCTDRGASGLKAAARLRKSFPNLKIVVMSGFDEITYAPRARAGGADAFFSKDNSTEHIVEVITTVMNGQQHFPEPRPLPLPAGSTPFTPREMDILLLLCEHKSRAEIAAQLFISEMTVKRHVANMLTKTGFSDSVELAFHVITNGWINPRY